jgi:uncharacterized protein
VLVDTGVFVTAACRDSSDYARCSAGAARARRAARRLGPCRPRDRLADRTLPRSWGEARFGRLVTSRRIDFVDLTPDDYMRCVELIEVYADLGLTFVDASVVAVAERLGIVLATLNRRDFTVARPRHVDAFDLLP